MSRANALSTKRAIQKQRVKGTVSLATLTRDLPASPIQHLRSTSPFRPHDWRWQRAKLQVADRRYATKSQDEIVTRLVSYLRLAETHPKRASVVWPALADTLVFRKDIALSLQARLEGYLLAGESNEAVSKRLDIPAEVVGVYESVFYSVRGRPMCPQMIIWELVTAAGGYVHENDWEILIRLIGLIGGPYLLDSYLEYLREPPPTMPASFDDMCDDELRAFRSRLLVRTYVLGLFPQVTAKNRKHWSNIAIFAELKEEWFRPDMCHSGRA